MNTTNFLYYDLDQQTWQPTTLEALATLNDPDLNIIPLDENNRQGKQTTWGNYTSPEYREAKKQAAIQAEQLRKNQQKQQEENEKRAQILAREQEEKQQAQENKDINLQDICDEITGSDIRLTCRHIRKLCRLITTVFWLGLFGNCAAAGIIAGGTVGLVIGFVVAGVITLIITLFNNFWEEEEEKKTTA